MRQHEATRSLSAIRDGLTWTLAALRAAGVHTHEVRPIEALGARAKSLDDALEAADEAVVIANACVAWRDMALDNAIECFARDLLHHCGGRRDDVRYRAFFPVAPNEYTRMALAAEIDATEHFTRVITEVALPKAVAVSHAAVLTARDEGREALAARAAAEGTLANARLRLTLFRDEVNLARASLHNVLERYRIDHGLRVGYPDTFFAPVRTAPRRAEAKSAKPPADGTRRDTDPRPVTG